MNLAFISYEYPPDTALGGIATYVDQISRVLSNRGHRVHVFCASPHRNIDEVIDNIFIHRIKTTDRVNFKHLVAGKFEEVRHTEKIEIIESPEFNADGLIIKKIFPDIPLIVRLHTPTFLIYEIIWSQTPFLKKIRKIFQDKLLHLRSSRNNTDLNSVEEEICRFAEIIHSPSESLASICIKKWNLDKQKVKVIPNVFDPTPTLLEIPIRAESKQKIFYFGRLEIRKGIYIFEKVIPLVLKKFPEAEFHFIGQIKTGFSGESFKEYLIRKCKKYAKNLYFRQVCYADIPQEMKTADICVFPSKWENFPNVCLEAMSAGKAIIASKNGGMYDMLYEDNAGILIDPIDYNEIAVKILNLLHQPTLIGEYGTRARYTVIKKYNKGIIGNKIEKEFFKYSGLLLI